MLTIWNTLLYEPFLNFLALIVSIVPGGDLGIAIIILTLVIKFLLYPLSKKSIEGQLKLKKLEPELQKIRKSGKTKEEQARLTFELYKQNNTNPFAGCLLVLIQIPIIFALYYVFFKGLNFDANLLYSFVPRPENLNTNFLGLIDIAGKSYILAVLAGLSQFLQAYFMPKIENNASEEGDKFDFAQSFAKSMQVQMKYVFPFVVFFISYNISGAIALYWAVSNLFAAAQQFYLNKNQKNSIVK
jgi:YidC/Oxa1 family membrane protein insertase